MGKGWNAFVMPTAATSVLEFFLGLSTQKASFTGHLPRNVVKNSDRRYFVLHRQLSGL